MKFFPVLQVESVKISKIYAILRFTLLLKNVPGYESTYWFCPGTYLFKILFNRHALPNIY